MSTGGGGNNYNKNYSNQNQNAPGNAKPPANAMPKPRSFQGPAQPAAPSAVTNQQRPQGPGSNQYGARQPDVFKFPATSTAVSSKTAGGFGAPPAVNYGAAAASAEEDEMLDISDTELIRASQAIESQIKFTNNVHHATSNAITIFSQFNTTANDMPAPSTFMGSSAYNNASQACGDEPWQVDELRSELKREKLQKDGEVRI